MTMHDFYLECAARTIAPSIALENDELVTALAERNDDEVIRILDEEF